MTASTGLQPFPARPASRAGRRLTPGRQKPARQRRDAWRHLPTLWVMLGLIVLIGAILAVGALGSGPATRAALAAELSEADAPPAVSAFYAARDHQPLWTTTSGLWPALRRASLRPEAVRFAGMVAAALPGEVSDRTARQLSGAIATAASGGLEDVLEAEIVLSTALGEYGAAGGNLAFVDPSFGIPATALERLQQAAEAPSLAGHLDRLQEGNPVYQALREDFEAYRRDWSKLPQVAIPPGPALQIGDTSERVAALRQRLGLGSTVGRIGVFGEDLGAAVSRFQAAHGLDATGMADAPTLLALNSGAARFERLILANLQRARLLPPPPGDRFILVNPAAGQLWLYEQGRPVESMRVVVGTRQTPTPMMAGRIEYLVFNPYWEVPVDMARDLIAPKVVRNGVGVLRTQRLQALSDWSDSPARLDPTRIDWPAVVRGRDELRLRQEPGGDNVMGAVKFMSPNELGIYLHDTPNKAAFNAPQRLFSAGCVRVERAEDLVAWLLGRGMGDASSQGVDNRIDLETPTPVYITYLTAAPGDRGVAFYPDVYGRDAAVLARLSSAPRGTGQAAMRGG